MRSSTVLSLHTSLLVRLHDGKLIRRPWMPCPALFALLLRCSHISMFRFTRARVAAVICVMTIVFAARADLSPEAVKLHANMMELEQATTLAESTMKELLTAVDAYRFDSRRPGASTKGAEATMLGLLDRCDQLLKRLEKDQRRLCSEANNHLAASTTRRAHLQEEHDKNSHTSKFKAKYDRTKLWRDEALAKSLTDRLCTRVSDNIIALRTKHAELQQGAPDDDSRAEL